MAWIPRRLRRLLATGAAPGGSPPDAAELRRTFQSRYHHFKLLLTANTKALEVIADIERALAGLTPFGMTFVKEACTSASVNVLHVVRNLDQLAPGKYGELTPVFKRIQERIDAALAPRTRCPRDELVLPLDRIDRDCDDVVGTKMARLGEAANRLGLRVPSGFVITARAFERFFEDNGLQAEIDRRTQAAAAGGLLDVYELSAALQQVIIRATVPDDVRGAIEEAHAALVRNGGPDLRIALRSSARGEDGPGPSVAGHYRSELNVSADSLLDAYKDIVASRYSAAPMIQRYNRGRRDEDAAMCVGCMALVPAKAGGVMYSRSPTDASDDAVLIHSAWGLPKAVVDAVTDADVFVVARGAPPRLVRSDVRRKGVRLACAAGEGIRRETLDDDEAGRPSLSEQEAIALAAIALRVERAWGKPQDIEWAIDAGGEIYVLQCRELQQAPAWQEPEGVTDPGPAPGPLLLEGGVMASPGRAAGVVVPVRKNADLLRFPRGGVLVAPQPLPHLAALLSRACAVVAEEGGIAGHLASVARSLGIPAIFGARGALAALPAGAIVSVDADRRRVTEGAAGPVTARPALRPALADSDVARTLAAAAASIVPLTLVDPDSPDFRPGRCETYHDVVRFCHERAVAEMFRFGRDHHFAERSSKQLVSDVPMQLWVLNLDDGFATEVDGPTVRLSNIVSVPMLALWEGMRAFPWEGPPPVDGRGLLSVLFQATTDPSLDPAVEGRFGDRNYFMIARHYCSLQSRFGFHFSSVEAMVSERAIENYATFDFKGGGADYHRRRARVEFIADLLAARGFRVDVHDDMVSARTEGLALDAMRARLKVAGYLTVHTRQLDMVLGDGAAAAAYRQRMAADLDALCAAPEPAGH